MNELEYPILVLSPHFDDAVLSCGRMLAVQPDATVVTVLGGSPPDWDEFRTWDNDPEYCGFELGTDVVTARRAEDIQALNILACRQRTIGALDGQYGPGGDRAAIIRDSLEQVLDQVNPATCLIPLGLSHGDHIEVRRISLLIARSRKRHHRWIAYEDLPYGARDIDGANHRKAFFAFEMCGLSLKPLHPGLDEKMDQKLLAVDCYESQMRALTGIHSTAHFPDDVETESYWEIGGLT